MARFKWPENDVRYERKRKLFDDTLEEYKDYVLLNHRFPTSSDDGKTKRGTSLAGWRRAPHPEEFMGPLLKFEEALEPVLAEYKRGLDAHKFYEDLITSSYGFHSDERPYPKTIKKYLEGDNRYKYFDIRTYVELMKYVGEPLHPELNEIRLVQAVFGWGPWKFVYYDVGLVNLTSRVDGAIESLTDKGRYKAVIRARFGLGEDREPKTLPECAAMFGVTKERIRQIEAKALRWLRHPTRTRFLRKKYIVTPEIEGEAMKRKVGHWFIINDSAPISLPSYQLEEALVEAGFDLDVPFPEYSLQRVTNRVEHEWYLGVEFLETLGLESTDEGRMIEYTQVTLRKNEEPFDTIAYIQECQLNLERKEREAQRAKEIQERADLLANHLLLEQAEREQLRRQKEERVAVLDHFRDSVDIEGIDPVQYGKMKHYWTTEVRKILKDIDFDKAGWISELNKLIKPYQISSDLMMMAQGVLTREIKFWSGITYSLGFRLESSNLSLNKDNLDFEFMYRLQIQNVG